MKKYTLIFLIGIFTFSTSNLISQTSKDTIWYDANWSQTIKDQASYFRPAPSKKDNGFWWVDYYLDGTKQMEALSLKENEELFDGKVTWYHANGKVMQIVNYKNNVPNGLRKNYHESGSLKSEYSYVNDKIDGEWVSYYENAKLLESGKYKVGKRIGIWKEYHKNGKLKGEGKYLDGKKIGVWKMYYYNGIEED